MTNRRFCFDPGQAGLEMHHLAAQLFPLHRSLTGQGARRTYELLGKHIPLVVTEVPTGTRVFDWEVPQEWVIRDAFIADRHGTRVVDYRHSNLHVVNYSRAINAVLAWEDLEPHIHYLPERPAALPYRTTYFRDDWGFCVNESQYRTLSRGGEWQTCVDAEFREGSLSMAEYTIAGETDQTILFYCHTCHPSLANDNLSGMVVATFLAKLLQPLQLRRTYRFVFAPATIGAITWLARQSQTQLDQICGGLVLSLLGDDGTFTYKQSCHGDAMIDRLVPAVLESACTSSRVIPFSPFGYDERQFGSAGINLPVGRLSRRLEGRFPEYHTSDDNLEFITAECLGQSLQTCCDIVESIEDNAYPVTKVPFGEPQLGKRDLYKAYGEQDDRGRLQEAILWTLNLANGSRNLLSIAERSGLDLCEIQQAARLLAENDLLEIDSLSPASERFYRYCQQNANANRDSDG